MSFSNGQQTRVSASPARDRRTPAARTSDILRVLVADGHPPERAGIRLALDGHGFVCLEALDASAAFEVATRERPDICLITVQLPGGGIETATKISAQMPHTPVVMLTASANEEEFLDVLRAGASGYVPLEVGPASLAVTLRAVARGEPALPAQFTGRLIDELRGGRGSKRFAVPAAADLTSREWDVLELMRQGLGTAEIAERLSISHVTVRRHIGAIVKKLGVPNREAALSLVNEE